MIGCLYLSKIFFSNFSPSFQSFFKKQLEKGIGSNVISQYRSLLNKAFDVLYGGSVKAPGLDDIKNIALEAQARGTEVSTSKGVKNGSDSSKPTLAFSGPELKRFFDSVDLSCNRDLVKAAVACVMAMAPGLRKGHLTAAQQRGRQEGYTRNSWNTHYYLTRDILVRVQFLENHSTACR